MHYDYDRWRAIRNEVTREDLGGLGNLTKCGGIVLLGETQTAGEVFFSHRQYLGPFKKRALRKLLRINRKAHYRRGVSEYNV